MTTVRILFEAKYDVSLIGSLKSGMFFPAGLRYGIFTILKADVTNVTIEKKLLSKKEILALRDGAFRTFDAGALGIDKAAQTIQVE